MSEQSNISKQFIPQRESIRFSNSFTLSPAHSGAVLFLDMSQLTENLVITLPTPILGVSARMWVSSGSDYDLVFSAPVASALNVTLNGDRMSSVGASATFAVPSPVAGSLFELDCNGESWVITGQFAGVLNVRGNVTRSLTSVVPHCFVHCAANVTTTLALPTASTNAGVTWRIIVAESASGAGVRLTSEATNVVYRLFGPSDVTYQSVPVASFTLTGGPAHGTVIDVTATSSGYLADIFSQTTTVS